MKKALSLLSSLRLTLVGLLWLAVGLVADQNFWLSGVWAITPPLLLLALNLSAAMFVDRRFRHQPMLFAFHLSLLLIAGIAGYGQLVTHEYRLLRAESQSYSADMLHPVRGGLVVAPGLAEGFIRQGRSEVDYTPGIRRGATRSELWLEGRGRVVIGDDVPLLVDGYRFYTTSNKGFSALFTWLPEQGPAVTGSVLFPSYPVSELMQVLTWQTPGGEDVEFTLGVPPSPYNDTWTLSSAHVDAADIVLSVIEREHTLRRGATISLRGGRLRYEQTGMWMGYQIRYDPTLPWLFSAAVLAVIFMAMHFALRLSRPAGESAVRSDGCVT